MSVSQEWTKVIRDVQDIFLAIRTSLRFTWASKRAKRPKPQTIRIATTQSSIMLDRRIFAELERRKSLAFLNTARTTVR